MQKTIRKFRVQQAITFIEEALESIKMENMMVDSMFPTKLEKDFIEASEYDSMTDLVKKRTRLYRESWVESPMEAALATLKKELNR
jgi:hypothetical protein